MAKPSTQPDQLVQQVLAAVRGAGHAGITSQQLALQLGIREKGQRYLIFDAIDLLLDEGRIESGKKGRYTATGGKETTEGNIDIISSGAGYVRLGVVGEDDVYVQQRDIGTALHGDTVVIKLVGGRGNRQEGKVVKVLKRRRTEFVGTLHKKQGRMILVADDQRIQRPFVIPAAEVNGAHEGEKVIMELGEWKDARDEPRGKVLRILGMAGEHQVEMHAILAEFGLPLEFPESVLKASEAIASGVTPEEIAKRRDVRSIPTLTIDPDDAKDLDDALSVRKLDNGNWEIGVHIADVSHYVQPGSVLDMEAATRATSVYLVDRVVPMLPEKLSNDLCSLHADSDKLSFSAIFELDDRAQIKQEWFGRTVMRSHHRFAYADAQAIIDGGEGEYKSEVLLLHQLAQVLRKERVANGALEIGGNEVKFKLDEQGAPLGVYEKVMGPANWLIEEFMLLANKRVAAWVNKRPGGTERAKRPFVYRIHDLPDPEKVDQLRALAKSFGFQLRQADAADLPHAINDLLKEVRGKEEENIIKQVAIRSMSKAVYSTENIGHYGLGFEHYTHFTSPIRRYPDLLVHRAMAHYLAGGKPLDVDALELSCKHSSRMEKQASDAERASIKYKQAEYLLARIGQSFEGIISGLTSWGIYVELRENKCEGLIGLRELPGDVFRFDKERYAVVGQRTGRKFQLGDELEVTIKAVDMERRAVDFVLTGEPAVTTSGKFQRRSTPKPSSVAPRKASSKGKRPKQGTKPKKGKKGKRR
ncbi:MAG TPA: ribonuclease R [Flavobacteriales bacterium]|nr:ribonuclease R [Flavobacteriales bacterium]MCC6911565.1 ribonuclease R [Flavobacteriales bacterium]HQW04914.1 ribonuclease R [Flavobacteriales bacterium]HQW98083.1 ribonuclease R [Flavobacteriales bacterium]HQX98464.1 ribonuclease R [Flavobacteriales bacterium]